MAPRVQHLDTTSWARRGADVPARDAQARRIPYGSAKDHRPDLQQAVLEVLGAHDGGVPLVSTSWEGHTSDTQRFPERAQALRKALASAPTPRYLVAEATLSTADTPPTRAQLGLITRLPGPLKLVAQGSSQALQGGAWQALHDTPRYQGRAWCHYGLAQRWLGVASQAALERAEASVTHAQQRAWATLEPPLCHVQAQRFETPAAAHAALAVLAQSWRSHPVETTGVIAPKRSAGQGRPPPPSPLMALAWQIRAQARPAQERIAGREQQGACFVIGTTLDASPVSQSHVIQAYKAHPQAASGLRFLHAPWFGVSSLFVKQPWQIPGLRMVRTFALLVYAVPQRRLRGQLVRHHDAIPQQITPPTERPTWRWVCPLLEGIHRGRVTVQDQVHDLLEGLNEVQINILRWFGEEVCRLYQIAPGEGLLNVGGKVSKFNFARSVECMLYRGGRGSTCESHIPRYSCG